MLRLATTLAVLFAVLTATTVDATAAAQFTTSLSATSVPAGATINAFVAPDNALVLETPVVTCKATPSAGITITPIYVPFTQAGTTATAAADGGLITVAPTVANGTIVTVVCSAPGFTTAASATTGNKFIVGNYRFTPSFQASTTIVTYAVADPAYVLTSAVIVHPATATLTPIATGGTGITTVPTTTAAAFADGQTTQSFTLATSAGTGLVTVTCANIAGVDPIPPISYNFGKLALTATVSNTAVNSSTPQTTLNVTANIAPHNAVLITLTATPTPSTATVVSVPTQMIIQPGQTSAAVPLTRVSDGSVSIAVAPVDTTNVNTVTNSPIVILSGPNTIKATTSVSVIATTGGTAVLTLTPTIAPAAAITVTASVADSTGAASTAITVPSVTIAAAGATGTATITVAASTTAGIYTITYASTTQGIALPPPTKIRVGTGTDQLTAALSPSTTTNLGIGATGVTLTVTSPISVPAGGDITITPATIAKYGTSTGTTVIIPAGSTSVTVPVLLITAATDLSFTVTAPSSLYVAPTTITTPFAAKVLTATLSAYGLASPSTAGVLTITAGSAVTAATTIKTTAINAAGQAVTGITVGDATIAASGTTGSGAITIASGVSSQMVTLNFTVSTGTGVTTPAPIQMFIGNIQLAATAPTLNVIDVSGTTVVSVSSPVPLPAASVMSITVSGKASGTVTTIAVSATAADVTIATTGAAKAITLTATTAAADIYTITWTVTPSTGVSPPPPFVIQVVAGGKYTPVASMTNRVLTPGVNAPITLTTGVPVGADGTYTATTNVLGVAVSAITIAAGTTSGTGNVIVPPNYVAGTPVTITFAPTAASTTFAAPAATFVTGPYVITPTAPTAIVAVSSSSSTLTLGSVPSVSPAQSVGVSLLTAAGTPAVGVTIPPVAFADGGASASSPIIAGANPSQGVLTLAYSAGFVPSTTAWPIVIGPLPITAFFLSNNVATTTAITITFTFPVAPASTITLTPPTATKADGTSMVVAAAAGTGVDIAITAITIPTSGTSVTATATVASYTGRVTLTFPADTTGKYIAPAPISFYSGPIPLSANFTKTQIPLGSTTTVMTLAPAIPAGQTVTITPTGTGVTFSPTTVVLTAGATSGTTAITVSAAATAGVTPLTLTTAPATAVAVPTGTTINVILGSSPYVITATASATNIATGSTTTQLTLTSTVAVDRAITIVPTVTSTPVNALTIPNIVFAPNATTAVVNVTAGTTATSTLAVAFAIGGSIETSSTVTVPVALTTLAVVTGFSIRATPAKTSIATSGTAVLTLTANAPVSRAVTITPTLTTGATISPTTVVFASGALTATTTITAGSSAAVVTITYASSDTAVQAPAPNIIAIGPYILTSQFATVAPTTGISIPTTTGQANLTLTSNVPVDHAVTVTVTSPTPTTVSPATSTAIIPAGSTTSNVVTLSAAGTAVGAVTLSFAAGGTDSSTTVTVPTAAAATAVTVALATFTVTTTVVNTTLFSAQRTTLNVSANAVVDQDLTVTLTYAPTTPNTAGLLSVAPASTVTISAGKQFVTTSLTAGATAGLLTITPTISPSGQTILPASVILTIVPVPYTATVAASSNSLLAATGTSILTLTLSAATNRAISVAPRAVPVAGSTATATFAPATFEFASGATSATIAVTAGANPGPVQISFAPNTGSSETAASLALPPPLSLNVVLTPFAVTASALTKLATSGTATLTLTANATLTRAVSVQATVTAAAGSTATATLSSAVFTFAVGATTASATVTAGTVAGLVSIAFTPSDAFVTVPAPLSFVVAAAGQTLTVAVPTTAYTNNTLPLLVSLGDAVTNSLSLSLTVTGGAGASASSSTTALTAALNPASLTLNTGTAAGTLTLVVTPTGGSTVAAVTQTITVAAQGTINGTVPAITYVNGKLNVMLALSAATTAPLVIMPAFAGTATATAAPVNVPAGATSAPLAIQVGPAPGSLTVTFALSGAAAPAYAAPAPLTTTVRPLLIPKIAGPTTPVFANNPVTLMLDLGDVLPAGTDLSGGVAVTFCATGGACGVPANVPVTFAAGDRIKQVVVGPFPSAGTIQVATNFAGNAAANFAPPPAAPQTFTITAQFTGSFANVSTSLFGLEQPAAPVNLTFSSPVPAPLSIDTIVSGPASAGVIISPANRLVVPANSTWTTFAIKAGATGGALTVSFAYPAVAGSPSNIVAPLAPITLTVTAQGTATSSLPSVLTAGGDNTALITLSAPPTRGTLTVTVTATGTSVATASQTPIVSTIAAGASSAQFTLTTTSTAGQVPIRYVLSGPAAVEYLPIQPATAIVGSATSISVNAPNSVFVNQTSNPISVIYGRSAADNTAASSISITATPAGLVTVTPSTISTAAGVASATFTVTGGSKPGLVTLSYAIASGSSFTNTIPNTVVAVQPLITATISGVSTSLQANSVNTVTVTLSQPLPAALSLTAAVALTGTAATGSNVSAPAVLQFPPGGATKASYVINAGTTLTDLTASYTLSGTGLIAVVPFPATVLTVQGAVTLGTTPSAVDANTTSSAITATLSSAIPTGSALTLTVKASAGTVTSGSTTAASVPITVSGTTATFTLNSPSTPQNVTVTYALSGTAAYAFTAPASTSYVSQGTITISGVPTSVTAGTTSSALSATLSSALSSGTDSLILTATLSGAADSSTSLSPPALAIASLQSQGTVAIKAGSTVGTLSVSFALSGSRASLYKTPAVITTNVVGASSVTNAPAGLASGATATITYTLSAAVPSGGAVTITPTASDGGAISPATLVFSGATTSQTFTYTATSPSTPTAVTISYAASGASATTFPAATSTTILVAAAGSVGHTAASGSIYTTQCTNVTVFFATAPTAAVSLTVTLSGTAATGSTATQVGGAALPLVVAAGSTNAVYQLCAGSTAGTLTATLPATVTTNTATVNVTAQRVLTVSLATTALTTGTTSATASASLDQALVGLDLTVSIAANGPSGTRVTGSPLVFPAGTTTQTFTVTAGYLSGAATLTYTYAGTGANAVAAVAPTTITFAYPSPTAFTTATITQSSNIPGAMNTYTVTFRPSQPVPAGSTIVIGNIRTSSPSANIFVTANNNFKALAQLAQSGSNTATLTVTVASTFVPDSSQTLTFSVVNVATAVTTATAMTLTLSGSTLSIASTNVAGSDALGKSDGTATPFTLTTKTVSESTQIQTATNTLSFAIRTSVNLPVGSTITISGIIGTTTALTSALPLTGTDASNFVGSVGALSVATVNGVDTYSVVLTVANEIPTSTRDAQFGFALTNPAASRTATPLTVTINGGVPVAATQLTGNVLVATSTPTNTFTTATIAESSNKKVGANTLTLTLAVSGNLGAGDMIMISGLDAARVSTTAGAVTIGGASAAVFGSTATFSAGVLTLTIASGMTVLSTDSVVVTVPVTNPSAAQSAATIKASSAGSNPITASAVTSTGVTAPSTTVLQAAGDADTDFSVATITDSSRVQGRANAVTVCLQPVVDIPATSTIKIAASPIVAPATSAVTATGGVYTSAAITSGQIALTGALLPANAVTCIVFSVTNSGANVAGVTPTISVVDSTSTVKLAPKAMTTPNGVVFGVTAAAESLGVTVVETNNLASTDNPITICTNANFKLPAGGLLTIVGFTKATGPVTTSGLAITSSITNFGSVVGWDQTTGTITATIASDLAVGQGCFMVTLTNPVAAVSAGRTITAAFSSPSVTVASSTATILASPNGGATTVFSASTASFFTKSISQTTTGCAFCPIYINLVPTRAITAAAATNFVFTLSQASSTATGTVPITGSTLFGSTAAWDATAQTLTLTLPTGSTLPAAGVSLTTTGLAQPTTASTATTTATLTYGGQPAQSAQTSKLFQAASAPVLLTTDPAAGAGGFTSGNTVKLLFDRAINTSSSGVIQFYTAANVAVGDAISCGGSSVFLSGKSLIITPPATVSTSGTSYYMTMSSGCVSSTTADGGLPYAGIQDSTVVYFTAGAGTVPALASSNPATGGVIARGTANLTLNFDSSVTAVASALTLLNKNGSVAATIKLSGITPTDTSYASVSGTTVSINVANGVFGTSGQCFCLSVPAGSFISASTGASFAGSTIEFCVGYASGSPSLTSRTPAVGASGVDGTAAVTLGFDRAVSVTGTTGSVRVFYAGSSSDSTLPQDAVYTVACSALTVSGSSVSFTPSGLVASPVVASSGRPASSCFTANVPAGCIQSTDATPVAFAGASWNFCVSGGAAPTIVSTVPAFGVANFAPSTGATTPITITFNSEVVLSCGAVVMLYQDTDPTNPKLLAQTSDITITSSTVGSSIVSVVTANFASALFVQSARLFVRIPAGAFKSARSGVAFAGLTGKTYAFGVAPTILGGGGVDLTATSRRRENSAVHLRVDTIPAAFTRTEAFEGPTRVAYMEIQPNTVPATVGTLSITFSDKNINRVSGSPLISTIYPIGHDYWLQPNGATFIGVVRVCTRFTSTYAVPATLSGTDIRTGTFQIFKMTTNADNSIVWTAVPQVPTIVADATDNTQSFACVSLGSFSEIIAGVGVPSGATTTAPGGTPSPATPPGSAPSGPSTIVFNSAPAAAAAPAIAMLLALAALLAALL